MNLGTAFLLHLAVASVAVSGVWLLYRRTGNAAGIDAAWAGLIGIGALIHAIAAQAASISAWGLPLLMAAWAARLGLHLLHRVRSEPEDGRYATLRAEWAVEHGTENVHRRMFWFYQAQALLAALLALPAGLASRDPSPAFGPWAVVAPVLGAISLAGAHVSDRQLSAFRRDPRNKGATCRAGLWHYSRHPNYFFEILLWVSFASWALPAPGGAWAFLAPAAIAFFLLKVTGIPLTEAQALRSRGDDYRRYIATTSPLVPWFPRKELTT